MKEGKEGGRKERKGEKEEKGGKKEKKYYCAHCVIA